MMRYSQKIISLAFITVFLSSCSGMSNSKSAWKEGMPITKPHAVSTIGKLELFITDDTPTIILGLKCSGENSYKDIVVSIEGSGNNYISHNSIGDLDCNSQSQKYDNVLEVNNIFHVGDTLEISLEANSSDSNKKKETVFYMVGTDKQLREGAGSVWR